MATSERPDWMNYLDPAHVNAPLHALNYSCCRQLALYLDKNDVLIHNGLVPNFGGLAELVGFSSLEIDAMERAESSTKKLLEEWKSRPEFEPTVGRLIMFLIQLDREDVLTDIHQMIREDVKAFFARAQNFERMRSAPIQDETVSQGPGIQENPAFITVDDVMHGRKSKYDAFICYNPSGRDLEFVKELIRRFEAAPNNFKLFVPCRNDLSGLNAHNITAQIISERCRHMIVVLSPNFLSSEACEFQSTFAHALSPGARNKRIVPIKIQDCPTPNILRIMACCDFTKKDLWDWSWDRLAKSIMVPLSDEDFQVSSSPNQEGLIQRFPFRDSPESGFSSSTFSLSSSRSASPALGGRQIVTEPIIPKPSAAQQPKPVEMVTYSQTAPVDPKRSVTSSPSGPFRKLKDHFSDKKQKVKK